MTGEHINGGLERGEMDINAFVGLSDTCVPQIHGNGLYYYSFKYNRIIMQSIFLTTLSITTAR
jgi:hypothetical protein